LLLPNIDATCSGVSPPFASLSAVQPSSISFLVRFASLSRAAKCSLLRSERKSLKASVGCSFRSFSLRSVSSITFLTPTAQTINTTNAARTHSVILFFIPHLSSDFPIPG
jgi:hypothetical protein